MQYNIFSYQLDNLQQLPSNLFAIYVTATANIATVIGILHIYFEGLIVFTLFKSLVIILINFHYLSFQNMK